MTPTTIFALLTEFGTAHIPITLVGQKYFGLTEQESKLKAAGNRFPFPVLRLETKDGKRKCPWLVDVKDLAEYIDKQWEAAVNEFKLIRL